MNNLRKLIEPKSIAVIGAKDEFTTHGCDMILRAIKFGFEGNIYPVNPKRREILGLKCYQKVGDLPEIPDAAFIIISASSVLGVAEECGKKGIKNLVVISSGFKEAGPEGKEREKQLIEITNRYNMTLVGPNCPGFISDKLHFMMSAENPVRHGGIVLISQSGGLTSALVDKSKELRAGIKLVIGVGNKVTNEVDIMNSFLQDEELLRGIRVVALYQESIDNPLKFLETAKEFQNRRIPVLSLKSGRTDYGRAAALSHTGAMASSDKAVDALFRKAGIIRVENEEELIDTACCFDMIAAPKGKRVAVITNAGGPGVIASDCLYKYGLELAKFSSSTEGFLTEIFRNADTKSATTLINIKNPLDIVGGGNPTFLQRVTRYFLESPDNDIVLVTAPAPPFSGEMDKTVDALVIARKISGVKKPLFVVALTNITERLRRNFHCAGLPVFSSITDVIKIIARMCEYAESQKKISRQSRLVVGAVKDVAAEIFVRQQKGFLPQKDVYGVLEAYGIQAPRRAMAISREDLEKKCMDFCESGIEEVVLKIESPDIIHKSDAGCVIIVPLFSEEVEPVYFYDEIVENAKKINARVDGVMIYEKVSMVGGKEVLVGVKKEAGFGHLIAFGEGGIYAEARGDVAFALTPLSEEEAEYLIKSTKFYKILKGVRGEKPVNFEELKEILLRISRLVSDFPQIVEIDLNPIMVNENHAICVDARMRIE